MFQNFYQLLTLEKFKVGVLENFGVTLPIRGLGEEETLQLKNYEQCVSVNYTPKKSKFEQRAKQNGAVQN